MRAGVIRLCVLTVFITFALRIVCFNGKAQKPEPRFSPTIPKTWDEAALADWATALAGLNQRPTHISSKEYYSLPVENLRTYPVYFQGREPDGYWEMLQRVGPQPLIEPEKLKTEADWIEAGRKVFDEATEAKKLYQHSTILFLDEIHHFNKSQQDALLPHLEQGVILLVGATTQNPFFALNGALLSRSRVCELRPLEEKHLSLI